MAIPRICNKKMIKVGVSIDKTGWLGRLIEMEGKGWCRLDMPRICNKKTIKVGVIVDKTVWLMMKHRSI